MANLSVTLDDAILVEIEHCVANLPDDQINHFLTELELSTEDTIDEKTLRFLKRLCGDYTATDFATTNVPNSIYTRARRENKLFKLTGDLPLSLPVIF